MPRKIPILVLTSDHSEVMYTLARIAVEQLRANIDRDGLDDEDIALMERYIIEGEKLCTVLRDIHPDILCPFTLGVKQ
jgi:hypothetical protein